MKDTVSLYMVKTIVGNNIVIQQISAVFWYKNKFKFLTRYVKNDIKESWNSVSLYDALKAFYPILKDKKIILKNDNGYDVALLKKYYQEYFNEDFNNHIYDVSQGAVDLHFKKTNLDYLVNKYNTKILNTENFPISVTRAQNLFLVAIKMFGLNLKSNNE
ncbi:hypothetical protein [Malacoplasma muris]|uniref:hypothetical protein n=1 Tax=Malacoplasma muris TaxID=2119 RepID=UPI00398EB2B6